MDRLTRRVALAALGVLALAAYGWRLPRGVDVGDECYYATFYVSWLRSGVLETGNLSAHQPGHLMVHPFVQAFALAEPGLDGLILYLRWLYAGMCLAGAGLLLTALRGRVPAAGSLAVAAGVVAFIPFNLPAPSYNTIALVSGACAAACLGRLATGVPGEPARLWVAAAGLFGSVQTLAYPTLAPVPFALAIACLLGARRDPVARRRLGGALAALLLGHAAVAAFVLAVFGTAWAAAVLEFARAVGANFDAAGKIALAAAQLKHDPDFLRVCGLGLAATLARHRLAGRPWARLGHGGAIALLLAYLFRPQSATLDFRGHGLAVFLCAAGLPVLRHLAEPRAARFDRFLALWYLAGVLGGLLTSWTSNNALMNFPVGGFGAVLAVLADWARPPRRGPWPLAASALAPWAAVAALAAASLGRSYGEAPGVPLTARLEAGPFAGLLTDPGRAPTLEALRRRVAEAGAPGERVSVLGPFPAPYLFSWLKLLTPHCGILSMPRSEAGLWPVLERHYANPNNRPEVVVWWAAPDGAHPAQVDVLARHYVQESSGDGVTVFRRRDRAAGGENPTLTQWGEGADPEETDGRARWRWCRSECTLTVTRFGAGPGMYRLRALAHSHSAAPSTLEVAGQRFALSAEPRPIERTLTLPPGRTVIRFRSDAEPVAYPERTLTFALRDFALEPAGE